MDACEFPEKNPPSKEIKTLLTSSKTFAIVGISANEEKTSYGVAKYLQDKGYKIIPVNPKYEEILGEKCYANLTDIKEPVDIVDIFRKPEALAAVVDEAIKIKPKCIWMQLGLCNNKAAKKAEQAGIMVVMNKCTKVEVAGL